MHNLSHEHLALLESHYGSLNLWLPDHGKRNLTYGSYRDSQRQKLYNAESRAALRIGNRGRKFANSDEIRNYINNLIAADWWRSRYQHITEVTVKDTRAKHAWARCWQNVIGIPSVGSASYRTEKTVLHELAHLVVKNPHPGHGPLYCRVYLDLVTLMMGEEWGVELEQEFKRYKVRYTTHPAKAANQTAPVYASGKGHRVRISARLYEFMAEWVSEETMSEETTFSGGPKQWDLHQTVAFRLLHPVNTNKAYTTVEVCSEKELDQLEDWARSTRWDYLPYNMIAVGAACGRLVAAIHKYSAGLREEQKVAAGPSN